MYTATGRPAADPSASARCATLAETRSTPVPSIDVPASTSRLASKILDREQLGHVNHVRALLSALAEGRDLIELGAYVPGTNPTLDRALEVRDQLDVLLRQDASMVSEWDDARRMLTEVATS